MHSLQFPGPKRHSVKMLNDIIAFCGVKYFRTVAHAQAASLSKRKQVFLQLRVFFIRKNNHILTKVITFFGSR